MPAQGGGGQQQDNDNGLGPMWIMLGIFIAGAVIWIFAKTYIIAFVFTVRFYEADFISLFVPAGWAQQLSVAKEAILTAKQQGYSGVSYNDMLNLSVTVGSYLRYPVAVILMGLGYIIYLSNPTAKFKKIYSMKTLLETEKTNWPQVIPVAKLDLVHTPINKGPWAMAMQPMDFAKAHDLLVVEKPKGKTRFEMQGPITASIKRNEARKIFALQLGRYWTSPEALPEYARALFGVFAARVNGDRDGATKLLETISRSSAAEKLDFTGSNELLRKHKDNKHIVRLTKRHAFELTVMASMLEFARQDGVIASADFLWLKPVDRKLWYTLNTVGRQTPFCEVSGVFAHWIAEKEFGKLLNVPMVEEAVNGLELAVKEIIYQEEQD